MGEISLAESGCYLDGLLYYSFQTREKLSFFSMGIWRGGYCPFDHIPILLKSDRLTNANSCFLDYDFKLTYLRVW